MTAKNIGRIFRISGRFLCGAGKAAAGLLKTAVRVLFWLLLVVFAAVPAAPATVCPLGRERGAPRDD